MEQGGRVKDSSRGRSKVPWDRVYVWTVLLQAVVQPLLERIKRWRFRDGGWQTVTRPNHSNCKCCLPSAELEMGLSDLELLPTNVVYSRRNEKLFQKQVQVTME